MATLFALGAGNQPIAKHDGIRWPASEVQRPLAQSRGHCRAISVIHALEHRGYFGDPARPLPHTALQNESFTLTRDEHHAHQLRK